MYFLCRVVDLKGWKVEKGMVMSMDSMSRTGKLSESKSLAKMKTEGTDGYVLSVTGANLCTQSCAVRWDGHRYHLSICQLLRYSRNSLPNYRTAAARGHFRIYRDTMSCSH